MADEHINANVLLVDDEEDFIAVLSRRLEARHLKVTAASSGQDALALTDRQDFDAIILDLAMPGMDGLETLKRIKQNHPEAEIIMLTGQGSIRTGIEAMKLGAEDFLEKPVDIQHLLERIKEAKSKRVLVLQEKSKDEIRKIILSKPW
ncbi:response regulator [Desulfofustis glycolicus]|jgi:DNA-binding NtrC family response regulator|uniref:Response regulator receiver domain-containing protein n=1 Tax=Desulfofustis glycolicus DSM 9705 TaxID=1121409 RepID=A0A1M5XAB8_9BACT|nr:response regulator [Desulfofustis glycolicus]MCB2218162.1 response regulator [Desulfobulbaceae bacterium]MEE4315166.1 response regulator [Desulfofustis sp.]SHH96498.1 Response regulator receiver domain-containing protein [Desulfofustis glycolicus DSM 9705]